ncbi:MAG: hypothetical protein EAZ14_12880, partial [Runella slithyformis]
YLQQMPNRGFQSSSDLNLVFGLGNAADIDSVTVIWPDDTQQTLRQVKADGELKLNQMEANLRWIPAAPSNRITVFKDITNETKLDFLHQENDFVDYNRDGLL